jgi:hypothetical protein
MERMVLERDCLQIRVQLLWIGMINKLWDCQILQFSGSRLLQNQVHLNMPVERGGKNDEIHIAVVDESGSITGTSGNILEKYTNLSKALTGKFLRPKTFITKIICQIYPLTFLRVLVILFLELNLQILMDIHKLVEVL